MVAAIIVIGWKMFRIDSQLERDTVRVAALPLCDMLLMNDANYPWLILVPRRASIREVIELNDNDVIHDSICVICNVFLGMS